MANDSNLKSALAYAVIRNGLLEPEILRDCVEDFVERHDVLGSLVEADRLEELADPEREQAMARIILALRRLAESGVRYRCTGCGYGSQRLIWHCPSCKAWETIRPVQTLQLENLVA
jgi:lipopolysaccharide biosynthesis regulator YciM